MTEQMILGSQKHFEGSCPLESMKVDRMPCCPKRLQTPVKRRVISPRLFVNQCDRWTSKIATVSPPTIPLREFHLHNATSYKCTSSEKSDENSHELSTPDHHWRSVRTITLPQTEFSSIRIPNILTSQYAVNESRWSSCCKDSSLMNYNRCKGHMADKEGSISTGETYSKWSHPGRQNTNASSEYSQASANDACKKEEKKNFKLDLTWRPEQSELHLGLNNQAREGRRGSLSRVMSTYTMRETLHTPRMSRQGSAYGRLESAKVSVLKSIPENEEANQNIDLPLDGPSCHSSKSAPCSGNNRRRKHSRQMKRRVSTYGRIEHPCLPNTLIPHATTSYRHSELIQAALATSASTVSAFEELEGGTPGIHCRQKKRMERPLKASKHPYSIPWIK